MSTQECNKQENSKNILVIDDDKDEQGFLLTAFQEVGPHYKIICRDNGKTGFYYLQQLNDAELPCLIVLDYNMPGWNGADVLFNLWQIPRLKGFP